MKQRLVIRSNKQQCKHVCSGTADRALSVYQADRLKTQMLHLMNPERPILFAGTVRLILSAANLLIPQKSPKETNPELVLHFNICW